MFYVFGLSVAFFLFVLILLKREKSRADRILLAWIGVLTIHLALHNVDYYQIGYQYPHLLGISLPLPVVHGAFLYFYTRELVQKETPLRFIKVLAHLLPFLALALLAIPFYSLSGAEKIEVYKAQGRGFEWYKLIQVVMFLVAGFGYSFASIWRIRKYRRQAVNTFSNLDRKMLTWLEYLAIGLGCIWLLSAFFSDQVVFAGVVFFVLFIGFFGINQYPVFYSISANSIEQHKVIEEAILAVEPVVTTAPDEPPKYAKSGLRDDDAMEVLNRLEQLMSTRESFRNPNLTLDEVAESLQISPNHLSQAINTQSGKTFYHYINTYRIKEFLKLAAIPSSRKFTYLGLAYQCGFTSKTTFNKYFKIETGTTPTGYFGVAEEASAERSPKNNPFSGSSR